MKNLEIPHTHTNKYTDKGITLIALIITVLILLILAGVAIGQLTGDGLFDKIQLAKEQYENAEQKENKILGDYENKINGYVDGSRETGSSKKEILFKAEGTGTREIQLEKNAKDYDFLIVYYQTESTSGDLWFDTSETAKYRTNYTYSSSYVIGDITLDIDTNKITMDVFGNYWTSTSSVYLTKVIGVKL